MVGETPDWGIDDPLDSGNYTPEKDIWIGILQI